MACSDVERTVLHVLVEVTWEFSVNSHGLRLCTGALPGPQLPAHIALHTPTSGLQSLVLDASRAPSAYPAANITSSSAFLASTPAPPQQAAAVNVFSSQPVSFPILALRSLFASQSGAEECRLLLHRVFSLMQEAVCSIPSEHSDRAVSPGSFLLALCWSSAAGPAQQVCNRADGLCSISSQQPDFVGTIFERSTPLTAGKFYMMNP